MNIKAMIPFLEDDELEALCQKIEASPDGEYEGVTVKSLLPFLDEDVVDKMLISEFKAGRSVKSFYPFASDDGLTAFVDFLAAGDYPHFDYVGLCPFLEDEALDKVGEILTRYANADTFEGYLKIVPYLDDDKVDALFLKGLQAGAANLQKIAPFVSDDGWHEVTKVYLSGGIQGRDLDEFYHYMDEDDIRKIFKKAMAH